MFHILKEVLSLRLLPPTIELHLSSSEHHGYRLKTFFSEPTSLLKLICMYTCCRGFSQATLAY